MGPGEERTSDTVKRIKISGKDTFYFIFLIEHKTKVDYNVSMQLLRYMVYIWEDYEKEMERQHRGISKTKGFRYPPVLPVVYYEGKEKWSASGNLKDRILFQKAFEPFTPGFFYKLIQLNSYSIEELMDKKDELRHFKISEDEIEAFTGQVKERKMGELFENFKGFDLPAAREKAKAEGWAEGHAEGEKLLLIKMVCKKLKKGKTAEEISEELEEELSVIENICRMAKCFAPDYDVEKVREALAGGKKQGRF